MERIRELDSIGASGIPRRLTVEEERQASAIHPILQIFSHKARLDPGSEYCILTFGGDIVTPADQLGGACR